MRTDWQGIYLDGQTAARHPATIRLMREALEISPAGGGTRLWPYRELRQTQGFYAGGEGRSERGGDLPETLLVADSAFLESLHEVAPGLRLRFHDPRRRRARVRWTIAAAAAVLAVTAAIYLWGIPALAALAAPRVPVAWEENVGRSAIAYLAPVARRCGDSRLAATMDEIVRRLTAPAPPSPYTLRVYVVNRPIVNAHALPGGSVVIFTGLLERTRTAEELAGVVAHELQTARTLGELRYSRRAEDEADIEGMKMLLAARIDPTGMIGFFDTIRREEGSQPKALTYFSTHPLADERIARLRSMAAAWKGTPEPLLPTEDWPALAKRC